MYFPDVQGNIISLTWNKTDNNTWYKKRVIYIFESLIVVGRQTQNQSLTWILDWYQSTLNCVIHVFWQTRAACDISAIYIEYRD